MATVAQALAAAVRSLEATSESPRLDAQLLLAHALGTSKEWLIAHGDEELKPAHESAYAAACADRASGRPIAYILGSAWFHGREFVVNRNVLVPRPETEHLVDDAIEHVQAIANPFVLDVGAGSGAIACTIAAEVSHARVDAIDISRDALNVARENAVCLGVSSRVVFYEGDLVAPLPRDRRYDAIVANLPYVPTAEIDPAPAAVSFEPRLALDGGADGLEAYRRLLPLLPVYTAPGAMVLLEAAPALMVGLEALARVAFPRAEVGVRTDYGGRERYVRVRCPSTGSR